MINIRIPEIVYTLRAYNTIDEYLETVQKRKYFGLVHSPIPAEKVDEWYYGIIRFYTTYDDQRLVCTSVLYILGYELSEELENPDTSPADILGDYVQENKDKIIPVGTNPSLLGFYGELEYKDGVLLELED